MINTQNLELIGHIGVDSGQVMIGDPCYIGNDFDSGTDWDYLLPEEAKSLNDNYKCPDNLPLNYCGACVASCSEALAGHIGTAGDAISVSSGFGDGYYLVYVEYSNEGEFGKRVKRVVIEFIGDETIEDSEDQ